MNDEIRSSAAWRPIAGFEGFYAVSAYGEVYSFRAGRRLKHCLDKDGYPRIILRVAGKYHTRSVHRLVAEAFHGDKRNALHCEVDHIQSQCGRIESTLGVSRRKPSLQAGQWPRIQNAHLAA